MTKRSGQLGLALLLLCSGGLHAGALERRADSIEAVRFDAATYRHHRYYGVSIRADVAIPKTSRKWGMLYEIGTGTLLQDDASSMSRFHLLIGVSLRPTEVSKLSLQGGYAWHFDNDRFGIGKTVASAKHYLRSPSAPVLPYIQINGKVQFIEPTLASPARQEESYRLTVIEALAGCEFRMNRDLAFVFEGGRSTSDTYRSTGKDLADGWIMRVAMQYDWF